MASQEAPQIKIDSSQDSAEPSTVSDQPKGTEVPSKKLTTIETQSSRMESQIAKLEAELAETKSKLINRDVETTVKTHIRLLHQYNEIKDVAQGLIGMIAEAEGKRQGDIEQRFGVGRGD